MKKSRRKANKWKKVAQKLQRQFSLDPGSARSRKLIPKLDKAYKNWYDAMGAK